MFFLVPGEAIHLLQCHLHLIKNFKFPSISLMETVPVLLNLGLFALKQVSHLLRHVDFSTKHLLAHTSA